MKFYTYKKMSANSAYVDGFNSIDAIHNYLSDLVNCGGVKYPV